MVTNQSNRYLFRDSFILPVLNAWVLKSFGLRDFNQTHNASMLSSKCKTFALQVRIT